MVKTGCLIDGCDGVGPYRNGWCVRHYQQWYRHGDPLWREKWAKTCSVEGCEKPRKTKGLCNQHYLRKWKHGEPTTILTLQGQTPEQRFWAKVNKPNDYQCWLWQGAIDKDGYGIFGVEGNRAEKAHRVSYQWAYGSLTDEEQVLHHCDTPGCVNPKHLFAGTNNDNMQDKIRKGRARYSEGEECHSAKLTVKKVRNIRERLAAGASQASIAREYGVDPSAVWAIYHRRSWKHI